MGTVEEADLSSVTGRGMNTSGCEMKSSEQASEVHIDLEKQKDFFFHCAVSDTTRVSVNLILIGYYETCSYFRYIYITLW